MLWEYMYDWRLILSNEHKTEKAGADHPELPHDRENLAETDQPPSKTPISNQYSIVAPDP